MANHTSTTGPRPLGCEEWIAMLTDAVDGVLPAGDAVVFEAHREACLACAELLEEAQRGAEWLRFLAPEPEVPAGLAERILAHTTGPDLGSGVEGLPALAPVGPSLPQPWFGPGRLGVSRFGGSLSVLYRHPAESRLLMTLAMAFFSIAFTLNLAGVRLKEIHLRDLRPSVLATNVSRGYYSASAHVMRYYENLRFVYELESRVNELRRTSEDAMPASSGARKQTPSSTTTQPPASQPPAAQNPTGQSKNNGSGGGAAERHSPRTRPAHDKPAPANAGQAETEPARILFVTTPALPRMGATSLRSSLPAEAGPHAPLTHRQDQAKRSLA